MTEDNQSCARVFLQADKEVPEAVANPKSIRQKTKL